MVQVHRTSSNLLEPHHDRDSKVCRVLPHEFGVVRLCRTFSNLSLHRKQGVQGAYALVRGGSSTFSLLEPSRTFSNHIIAEIARCVHEFGVVRLCRTFSTLIFTGEPRCAGCLCTSSGWFKHIEPPRTFSNHFIAEIARCVEFFHMSSEWFDYTQPSLTTSLQGSARAVARQETPYS